MVEQDIAALLVEGDLAGHPLEAERYPLGTREVAAGDDAQEAVLTRTFEGWLAKHENLARAIALLTETPPVAGSTVNDKSRRTVHGWFGPHHEREKRAA